MKKIMFNDSYGLTQAVLECRKTQTRRIINVPQHAKFIGWATDNKKYGEYYDIVVFRIDGIDELIRVKSRYKVGEIVAIAQSYREISESMAYWGEWLKRTIYRDKAGFSNKMFAKADLMPNKIKITSITVQRLQDISEDDCIKEGIEVSRSKHSTSNVYCFPNAINQSKTTGWCNCYHTAKDAYKSLINKICGKETWERNGWVLAYEFELVKQ